MTRLEWLLLGVLVGDFAASIWLSFRNRYKHYARGFRAGLLKGRAENLFPEWRK